MVKIKIFICTIWIAAFCVTIGGCKSYRQSRKQNQKLYNAIETNEVEAAKEAIDDGANMNSFRNIGLTMDSLYGKSDKNPVYADTAMHEDNKIAQYLIRKGADPNYKDKDGISLLMLAAQYGNLKVLKYAVKNKISVREENADFQNIFDLAIKSNNIDTIKYLMDIIKPSPKDICESIENSIDSISEKTLGYLLTKLTDINISPEDNDENILETAAMSNRIDLAELLIKKKAVVTPIALINAVDTGNIKLVKLLLSNGGEVNKIGKYSDGEKMTSALYEAITLGDFPMVKFLIKEGAGDTDIKEAVTDGNSYRIKKYIYQKFPGLQDD